MSSRAAGRISLFWSALRRYPRTIWRRQAPTAPKRILIAHNLLLGDTLMLTPLIAKLRWKYPHADIVMTVSPALTGLYTHRPYGIRVLGYNPRSPEMIRILLRSESPFDLAFIPGDARYAMLAHALGASWIVAFADDRPRWKNWLSDERVDFPSRLTAEADLFAMLVPGIWDGCFDPGQWSKPLRPDRMPVVKTPYVLLHVGAGNPLRLWPASHWRALAKEIAALGLNPVLSCGPGEQSLIDAIDPEERFSRIPGNVSLEAMWHILADSAALVCLDSGISHLAKHTQTPTVAIFGPGSPDLFGPGSFWRDNRYLAVWNKEVPCRDQRHMFKREREWIRRCGRKPGACETNAECIRSIDCDRVFAALRKLLPQSSG